MRIKSENGMGRQNGKLASKATLTAAEIEREAWRVLRYLAEREARLAAVNDEVYALHHGARLERRVISQIQYDAGERLRRDYTHAQIAPRLVANLETPVLASRRPADPISDRAIAAGQSFRAALASAGPGLSDLLFDICCALK